MLFNVHREMCVQTHTFELNIYEPTFNNYNIPELCKLGIKLHTKPHIKLLQKKKKLTL